MDLFQELLIKFINNDNKLIIRNIFYNYSNYFIFFMLFMYGF